MSLTYSKVEITLPNGNKFPAGCYINSNAPADAPLFIWGSGSGEALQTDPTASNILSAWNRLIGSSSQKPLLLNAEVYGFHVLVPLFIKAYNDWRSAWTGGIYIETCIDWAVKNMPINPKRVILIGWSEGGCMVKDAVSRNNRLSSKIAGGVVLAGGGVSDPDWKQVADHHIPLYFYHAQDDRSDAPYSMSTSDVDNINKFNPDPRPVFIKIAMGGHAAALSGLTDQAMYAAALKWRSDDALGNGNDPEPEVPQKTVIASLTIPNYGEIIAYSDKTAIVKVPQ